MNRKQREKNRTTAAKLQLSLPLKKQLSKCQNCGECGAHFVPPCFGDSGLYMCKPQERKDDQTINSGSGLLD